MSTTLPGIFSFRAKEAKICGLKLARPAVKTQKDASSSRCYRLATRGRTAHVSSNGQNKADDDDEDDLAPLN